MECQSCKGDPKEEWARDAVDPQRLRANGKRARLDLMEEYADADAEMRPHDPVWSGDLIFCTTCGAYAETKSVKLKGECSGKPKSMAATAERGDSIRNSSTGGTLAPMRNCPHRRGSMDRCGSLELANTAT